MIIYERGNAAKQWILEELDRHFGQQPGTILDLGCGNGKKWHVFLPAHSAMTVVGVDTDDVAIMHGREQAPANLKLHVSDAQHPIEGPFQAVTAFSAIEHVVDRKAFLKTVWDALAPGGVAYLNYDDGHFRSSDIKERVMVPVSQLLAMFGMEGAYMKHVDDADFQRMATDQGFRVINFRKHNLGALKGFMRGASDEAIASWYAYENKLGELYTPEKLDKLMLSSTVVLQKP